VFDLLTHGDASGLQVFLFLPKGAGLISQQFVQADVGISEELLGGLQLVLVFPDEDLEVDVLKLGGHHLGLDDWQLAALLTPLQLSSLLDFLRQLALALSPPQTDIFHLLEAVPLLQSILKQHHCGVAVLGFGGVAGEAVLSGGIGTMVLME
jgi:hypothetical protein